MKCKAFLMIILSVVLTLGTGLPAYAAAEGAVTESAYEEADSEESLTTGEGLPQESGSFGSETDGYVDSDPENVRGESAKTADDSESDRSTDSAESKTNDKADSSAGKESTEVPTEASDSKTSDVSDSASVDITEGDSDTAKDVASDSSVVPAKRASEGDAAQNAAGLRILSLSDNAYGKTGTSVTFHIETVGDGNAFYQWQYRLAGSSKWKSPAQASAKTADYSFEAKTTNNGYKVYCIITDANGNSVRSETVSLTTVEKPVITLKNHNL